MRLSREFADLTAAGALSALLFATGAAVPLLGPPAGFFSAAPLIWASARHGRLPGLLGALLGVAALLPTLPPPVTLIYAIEHALPAWFLGQWIAGGRPIARGAALAAIVVTALVLGAALLLAGGDGGDPVALIEEQLRAALAEIGGGAGVGVPAALPENFEAIMAFLRRALPAVTLVGIFVECAVNTLVATRVLARGNPASRPPDLAAFALPEWLVWALIPALALVWAPLPPVATLALNVLIPLLVAYLLQGFSIMLHFAVRARVGRFGRVLGALSFAISPYLLVLPLVLGMVDFRVGFRSRWPPTPPAA